jgi:hypothetical protein
MRLQIALPPDVGEIIKAQAQAEHRQVRQQVEHIVIQAVHREGKTAPAEVAGAR